MHKVVDPYKMRLYAVHIICAKWMAVYGYARVSTDGQSLAAQVAELKAAKCEKIFQEKISGARSDRKQLDHRFHETGLMHGIHLASEAL